MQRSDDQGPENARHAVRSCTDRMAKFDATIRFRYDLESVFTFQPLAQALFLVQEGKLDTLARLIPLDAVVNRSVAAGSASLQISFKLHPGPVIIWPEAIIPAGNCIQQFTRFSPSCLNNSAMYISNHFSPRK